MIFKNLFRRKGRTILTLLGIAVGVAAIVALGAVARGMEAGFTAMTRGSEADLVLTQAEAMSALLSSVDEAWPTNCAPGGRGEPLTGRHQVIVGKNAAEQMGIEIGDTLRLLKSNFRVVGIYETGISYEDVGVVVGLREAQALTGKPHQVMYYAIKLRDPGQAEVVKEELEAAYPDLDFALTAEIAESMSDFQVLEGMVMQISLLAIFIGGLGMLNTMLMSVLERTREIGVLRALGWRKRQVLGMILQESVVLGVVGGLLGILLGFGLGGLVSLVPGSWGAFDLTYTPQILIQAVIVALVAGAVGGLYPAWRATRMRPVEALRYE